MGNAMFVGGLVVFFTMLVFISAQFGVHTVTGVGTVPTISCSIGTDLLDGFGIPACMGSYIGAFGWLFTVSTTMAFFNSVILIGLIASFGWAVVELIWP